MGEDLSRWITKPRCRKCDPRWVSASGATVAPPCSFSPFLFVLFLLFFLFSFFSISSLLPFSDRNPAMSKGEQSLEDSISWFRSTLLGPFSAQVKASQAARVEGSTPPRSPLF